MDFFMTDIALISEASPRKKNKFSEASRASELNLVVHQPSSVINKTHQLIIKRWMKFFFKRQKMDEVASQNVQELLSHHKK